MGRDVRREAPWDRLDGYNLPVETSFTVVNSNPVMIANGNPMRVLLVIQPAADNPFTGYWGISLRADATPDRCMANVFYQDPLVIDWRKWGPACAAPWYALNTQAGPGNASSITVIEITAREWVDMRDFPSLIQQADDGYFRR